MSFSETFEKIFKECSLDEYIYLCDKFEILAKLLKETNEKYNLTAITDDEGIVLRHFADSLTSVKYIGKDARLIDVGTGGGFPSLPIAIARKDVRVTALDSTSKKLCFIDEVSEILGLDNIKILPCRAEEASNNEKYREKFDSAVSRAVARLDILDELCIPFVKVGGNFIAMKGQDGLSEIEDAKKGIEVLGGKIEKVERFTLLSAGERTIVNIVKTKKTDIKYPRAYAKIKKSPL